LEAKKMVESLERIISFGEKLLTTFDVEELLTQIVQNVQELLQAEGATLYLIDPLEKLMISQVILSDRVEEIVLNVDNNSIAGFTALHRSTINIPDAYSDLSSIHPDLKFNKAVDEAFHYKTRNILTHPLIINNELIGVFQSVNKKVGRFNDEDLIILRNFSIIAGIAIMNARLMERVMEEQSNALGIVEHISEKVIIQDREGKILQINRKAAENLPVGFTADSAIGKNFIEMFPNLSGVQKEVRKVIEHNLDRTTLGGKMQCVILTSKNSKKLVERVIMVIQDISNTPLPAPAGPPPDSRL